MAPTSSDYSKFATQHRKLLDEYVLLNRFARTLYNTLAMQAMASPMRRQIEASHPGKSPPRMSVIVSQALALASAAGVDDVPTVKAIGLYLRAGASAGKRMTSKKLSRSRRTKSPSEKIIDAAIGRKRAAIEAKLREIPPSIEKSLAALAYEVEGEGDGPPDALLAFGVDEARSRFYQEIVRRRQQLLNGDAMGISARGYEPYWYTSYLRYYESFEPRDARAMLIIEARGIEEEVRSAIPVILFGGKNVADELPRFIDLMFAYGRCRTVRHLLVPIARRAFPHVLRLQKASGAWSDWERPRRENAALKFVDDTGTTASAVVFLARYGSPQECEKAFDHAQRWLVDAQIQDGSWRSNTGAGLPISTTTVALEALKLTGIPADHPAISRGEKFLLESQEPPGTWSETSGLWQTHVTAQVIEYFQSRAERTGTLNSYLISARSLLLKSEQLTLSEEQADGPLATAAAYHGIEHFLYGCLLHMNSNEDIYADNKSTTIGFGAALGAFERALHSAGKIQAGASLPYRQQLRHIGAKRDMFVHRAESVSVADAFGFVAVCRSFVQRFDLAILGFRLCE